MPVCGADEHESHLAQHPKHSLATEGSRSLWGPAIAVFGKRENDGRHLLTTTSTSAHALIWDPFDGPGSWVEAPCRNARHGTPCRFSSSAPNDSREERIHSVQHLDLARTSNMDHNRTCTSERVNGMLRKSIDCEVACSRTVYRNRQPP